MKFRNAERKSCKGEKELVDESGEIFYIAEKGNADVVKQYRTLEERTKSFRGNWDHMINLTGGAGKKGDAVDCDHRASDSVFDRRNT